MWKLELKKGNIKKKTCSGIEKKDIGIEKSSTGKKTQGSNMEISPQSPQSLASKPELKD